MVEFTLYYECKSWERDQITHTVGIHWGEKILFLK